MIAVREATEADAEQIRQVFVAIYGKDYSHPQFYDIQLIKKMIYADDTILVVAEDTDNGRILGTASVLLEMGAHSDLLGEFGRLAVHPDARRLGVGKLLMKGRLDRLTDRLHLALVEPRAVHPFAQKIALGHGFAPVGFQPMKLLLDRRESLNVFVYYFGESLTLRKNNPRIIPEVYPLAKIALENCGLTSDPIVEAEPGTYPHDDRFELDDFTDDGYATLLRFQRGRVRQREIFGPVRLHHGLFRIRALQSNYLLARAHGQIVGAVGFSVDELEKTLRIFELISLSERPVRFLLSELLRTCVPRWGIDYLEVDVSAYAPRMQRTVLELGFLPAAYIPAMVFHEVERLDGIRMVRLMVIPEPGNLDLIPESRAVADLVLRGFITRQIIPKIAAAVPKIPLFAGMNDEQIRQVAGRCTAKTYQPGEQIIRENEAGEETFIVLEGEVSICTGQSAKPVGTVGASECLGEMSFLTRAMHSATAAARTVTETAVLPHRELDNLIRLRPDIGVIIYHNLATGLGKKLIRSDRR